MSVPFFRRQLALPLGLQLLGLVVGALIVAQVVTLILTLFLPPAPVQRWNLDAVAASLMGREDGDMLERRRMIGPPDISQPGWLVSESSREALAKRVGRPVGDVVLAFYTQLPVGGAAVPVNTPSTKLRSSAADPAPLGLGLWDAMIGVAHAQGGPGGGGMPGGGMPGGGFPGGGFPGGGFPAGGFPGGGFPNGGMSGGGFPGGRASGGGGAQRTQTTSPSTARTAGANAPSDAGQGSGQPSQAPAAAQAPTQAPAAAQGPASAQGAAQGPGQGPGQGQPAQGPASAGPPGGGGQSPAAPPLSPMGQPAPVAPLSGMTPDRAATPRSPTVAAEHLPSAPDPAHMAPTIATSAPTAATPAPAAAPASAALTRDAAAPPAPQGAPQPIPFRAPQGILAFTTPPFIEGDFIAAMRRPDGGWTAVAPKAEPFPNHWQRQVMAWFLLSLLVVTPLVWLFTRRLVKPLEGFARAAETLGRDPSATVVPLSGPAEIGRAAHAFNQMRDRLRAFVDDRTAMVGAISHDLRTPLTRLRFRLEDVPDDQREEMLADVDEMELMISQVIAFIRDASTPGPRERIDLATLVESTVNNARLLGNDIPLEISGRIPVEVDPVGMRRLLANLLENAVKYGVHARVRVSMRNAVAIAEVVDDGPGIPEDERERAFEPFFRCEQAAESEKPGSGLGLAVCRSIARAHGGDIYFEQRADGFVACLTLPTLYDGALPRAA